MPDRHGGWLNRPRPSVETRDRRTGPAAYDRSSPICAVFSGPTQRPDEARALAARMRAPR